jgi:hypothetical protein
MASLWQRGEQLAEIRKGTGTWEIVTDTGEVLMHGWREALESFLRAAGWSKVE